MTELTENERNQYEETIHALQEGIADLELAMEDRRYIRLTAQADLEFSRSGLQQICELSRVMYLKNPLIQRGVEVQAHYVFGQGVTLRAADDLVNQVIQDFIDDPKNQAELTTQRAMTQKERDLQVDGNLFFVFFINPATGRVRLRTIPTDEVTEIISNPEDSKEIWFYRRVWNEDVLNYNSGIVTPNARQAYYPDWRYRPTTKPATIGQAAVRWDEPVYHVKIGGLAGMKFGVPEVYAAIDWAMAYKSFLEDWATLVRSLSKFAWRMTVSGNKNAIQAAKTRLASTVSSTSDETNPPPTAGSVFIGKDGYDLTPMPKSGATISAEDGRRLLLMVAAAQGLPESFYGDVSVGNLATAKSLDRPTELKMKDRQSTWSDIFIDILRFVIYQAAKAPGGPLNGKVTVVEDSGLVRLMLPDNKQVQFHVTFPPILEADVQVLVNAIVQAATLGGQMMAGTIDAETVSRMLLTTLNVQDVDAALERLAQTAENAQSDGTDAAIQQAESGLVEAIRELRAVIREANRE